MKLLPSDLRNSFGSSLFDASFLGSSLIDVQRKSYSNFLHGSDSASPSINEVLGSLFPIRDAFGSALLEFVSYRVAEPRLTVEECRRKATTYSADIYVTVRLVLFDVDQTTGVRKPRNIKEQELLLCSMPMMTDNATFMVNGFERVVVSQIYRSPGVFFASEAIDNNVVYSASIMPYRGSRLDIILDQRGQLFFSIGQRKKLSIYYLLSAMQMDAKAILHYFHTPLNLEYNPDLGLWKLALNLSNSLVGKRSVISILNSSGELFVAKGSVINQQCLLSLQGQDALYCTTSDLSDSVLMENIIVEGELIWGVGTVMTDSILETVVSNGLHNISIIDFSSRSSFSPIVNAVLSNIHVSHEAAMEAILKVLYPSELFTLAGAKQRFDNTFFNPAYYSLFPVGRYKLNTALGLDIPEDVGVLRYEDILLTIKKLLDIKESFLNVDDIDSLVNRRVRSVGELLENQFRASLSKVTRNSVEKLNTLNAITADTALPEDLIIFTPITRAIREFFATSQLSQFMDQTNPLAELAHKRRISALGAGGLSRDRAGIEVRDVHPTHYGRICPIETPEGHNIGLISGLATYATINRYGFIETPYRKVVNRELTDEIAFLDATQDSSYVIGQADASIVSDGKIIKDLVSARKAGESAMVNSEEVQMMDISPKQTVSVVASLIPFLENDDAKRSLMGSNMQRQAVPLIVTEAPLIGAGMEREVTVDAGVLVIARRSGVVVKADSQHVMVRVFNEDGSLSYEIDEYSLRKFRRSNQNTCINQVILVKKGDRVSTGDIIADGPATSLGEIALGKNLLVAFMPWCGYNFEDSIIISEAIVHSDVFTSIHIEEFELVVRDTRLGAEEVTIDIPNASEESLRYLDEAGVVHLGANVTTGDILVGKITPRSETPVTPEEKLLRSIFEQEIAEVSDSSLRMPPGMSGTVVDVQILTRRDNEKDARAKYIEQQELIALENLYKSKLAFLDNFFLPEVDALLLNKKAFHSVHGKKTSFDSVSSEQLAKYSVKEKFNFICDDAAVTERLAALKAQYEKNYN
jgi:DNA-directed RNA polymerase subunit beta